MLAFIGNYPLPTKRPTIGEYKVIIACGIVVLVVMVFFGTVGYGFIAGYVKKSRDRELMGELKAASARFEEDWGTPPPRDKPEDLSESERMSFWLGNAFFEFYNDPSGSFNMSANEYGSIKPTRGSYLDKGKLADLSAMGPHRTIVIEGRNYIYYEIRDADGKEITFERLDSE